jgi:hypothetical protein
VSGSDSALFVKEVLRTLLPTSNLPDRTATPSGGSGRDSPVNYRTVFYKRYISEMSNKLTKIVVWVGLLSKPPGKKRNCHLAYALP